MAPSSHASNPKVESSKQTVFTPEMRDRQARGKDPYHSDSEDSDWAPGQTSGHGDGTGPARSGSTKRDEPFGAADRRRVAVQILNNPELLTMAAMRDDETIPATRLKYTRVLCDIDGPTATRMGTARHSSTITSAAVEKQRKRLNPEQN